MSTILPQFGHQLVVSVKKAGSSVYTPVGMINTSRGIKWTKNTDADELIDYADQSAPATTTRRARSVDITIDGAGMVHKEDVKFWWDSFADSEPMDLQFTDGSNILTAPFELTSFSQQGERTRTVECQFAFEIAGPYVVSEVN